MPLPPIVIHVVPLIIPPLLASRPLPRHSYADMEPKEFAALKNGKKMMQSVQDTPVPWSECPSVVNASQPADFPASVDWRTKVQ